MKFKNNFIVTIPARYKSSRLPGKPLLDICGKSMVMRVWEKCSKAVGSENVIILTDDERIINHCKQLKMNYFLTNKKCLTGSDRIYDFSIKNKYNFYINVQGDEPLISYKDIKLVLKMTLLNKNKVINCMTNSEPNEFNNKNVPKVVTNINQELIYMSRAGIPSSKNLKRSHNTMKQVCIYGYPYSQLKIFGRRINKTPLEKLEDIEILRFLEMGITVKMLKVKTQSVAVDTYSDLKKVRKIINEKNIQF